MSLWSIKSRWYRERKTQIFGLTPFGTQRERERLGVFLERTISNVQNDEFSPILELTGLFSISQPLKLAGNRAGMA